MPRLKTKDVEKKKSQRPLHASVRRGGNSGQSTDFVKPVRELLMLRIVAELEKRQWTQVQSAEFFGVSQPRISDLTRGLTSNFTIDGLVQWIGLLGMDLKIDTESGGATQDVFAWLDDSEKAIPYYTKLIAANPSNAENYWKRAYAYHRRGQYELAVGDFTRGMELDSSLQYLRINRAQSYICLGQHSSAFLDCEQLLAANPDENLSCWAYITKASAYQALGRDADALVEYKNAIRAAPFLPAAYFHRGTLHERMNNHRAALKDFSKVLELEPQHTEAQKRCRNLRKKRGD